MMVVPIRRLRTGRILAARGQLDLVHGLAPLGERFADWSGPATRKTTAASIVGVERLVVPRAASAFERLPERADVFTKRWIGARPHAKRTAARRLVAHPARPKTRQPYIPRKGSGSAKTVRQCGLPHNVCPQRDNPKPKESEIRP